MAHEIDFRDVLEMFESYGWKLQRIWEPYRVFVKEGELPWLIPVLNRKVDVEYVKKFQKSVEDAGET